jgi:serine protease
MMKSRSFLLVVAVLMAATFSTAGAEQAEFLVYDPGDGGPVAEYLAQRVVVGFAAGVGDAAAEAIARAAGARLERAGYGRAFHLLNVPAGREWAVINALANNPRVRFAHPDWVARTRFTPNDPLYDPYQWNLNNTVYGGIESEAAWAINGGGSPSVVVAIVDTGVAYENFGSFCLAPDLAGTNFVPGWDFIDNHAHPNDCNSHGTHVAGTVAQTTHNNLGVAGIAFNTSIMPVRVLDCGGSGSISAVASGIRFAADNGAHVINRSLGTTAPAVFLGALQDAVKYAHDRGVLQVAAAGNSNSSKVDYPARYAEVIAVGATTYNERRAPYSNYGTGIELVAPGGNANEDLNGDGFPDLIVQNTFNPNTQNPCDFAYWGFQGTSMAAPHVSGVAALLFAAGAADHQQVRQILRDTAKDLGAAGFDSTFGYGRVSAGAALAALTPLTHDVAVTAFTGPGSVTQGDDAAYDVTVANHGTGSETFTVRLTNTTDGVLIGSESVSLNAGGSTTVGFVWSTGSAATGAHNLLAEAVLAGDQNPGNNSMAKTVTVNAPLSGTTMHVGDLQGSRELKGRSGRWEAFVTVTIHDAGGNPVANATVTGTWSGAASGTVSGPTGSNGSVTFSSGNITGGTSVTFTVDNVTHNSLTYDPSANTATSITINR